MNNNMEIAHGRMARPTALLRINSPCLQLGDETGGNRRIRVALPRFTRRPGCLTRRAIIAAMRAAELAEWEASGGDFLKSSARRQTGGNAQI